MINQHQIIIGNKNQDNHTNQKICGHRKQNHNNHTNQKICGRHD